MYQFWEFAKLFLIINGTLFALFIILLSIPQSKLRIILFKIFGITAYCTTGLILVYIISPLDLLPDIIPVIGQMDDAAGIITAIFTGLTGWLSFKKSIEPSNNKKKEIE